MWSLATNSFWKKKNFLLKPQFCSWYERIYPKMLNCWEMVCFVSSAIEMSVGDSGFCEKCFVAFGDLITILAGLLIVGASGLLNFRAVFVCAGAEEIIRCSCPQLLITINAISYACCVQMSNVRSYNRNKLKSNTFNKWMDNTMLTGIYIENWCRYVE